MAFGFLDAVGLISTGAGIYRDIRGPDEPESLPALTETADRADAIARALSQPNLGEFSYLIDEEQDTFNRDTATALRQLQDADRQIRVRSASGLGILQSDRRDETIAREAIRARETSRARARDAARSYLTGALEANQIAMGGFGDLVNRQSATNQNAFQRGGRVLETVATAAPKLEGLFDRLSQTLDGTPTRLNLPAQAPFTYSAPFNAQPTQAATTYRPPFVQRT